MNGVSIIINGMRYDAVEDPSSYTIKECDLYDDEKGCTPCIIGMYVCERFIGLDGIFKKFDKKFEK